MTPLSAMHYIRKQVGYDEFLQTYADERRVNVEDWTDIVEEIQATTKDIRTIGEWLDFTKG